MSSRLAPHFAVILLAVIPPFTSAATLSPVYLDGANEGFNDPGPPDPQAGDNPGTTLGEQRQWAFEEALAYWGNRLQSNVTIFVDAEMNNLSCDSNSAVLGSAGATTVHRDWSPNPPEFSATWYGQALANSIREADLCGSTCDVDGDSNPDDSDIAATFNKRIDESNNCLGSFTWYYGLGDAPSGKVSFFKTVLHEIGHGTNFFTLVDLQTGEKALCSSPSGGCDDIYMKFLEAHGIGTWPALTNQEREDSATNSNNLHWVGSNVLESKGALNDGTSGDHVEMYAPSSLELGSSVSHWDTDHEDRGGFSELMEPSATGVEKFILTDEALEDMGWNEFSACGPSLDDEVTIASQVATSNTTYQACRTLTMGSDFAVQNNADVVAEAAYGVAINGETAIEQGSTFTVRLDPTIGAL